MDLIINEIYHMNEESEKIGIKYYSDRIKAGSATPATDSIEKLFDPVDYLVNKPGNTFAVKVDGDSMEPEIHSGDLLIVDTSIKDVIGKIIIGSINGDFTVKRLEKIKNKLFLKAENEKYRSIEILDHMNFSIFGVVTYIIHEA